MSQQAPTTAEVRAAWDSFGDMFAARMEQTTLQLATTLVVQLHLGEAKALVEVGSGAGGASALAHPRLPADARHVVTDLSGCMVGHARRALPRGALVVQADAEVLPLPDASFDRLLANLNLMIVPDTDRALAEAARVLEPGGLAAWSVWGRPEHSPMFTLPPRAAEAAGVELPAGGRSNFHLSDRDALRARIASHGFEQVLAWYQPMPAPVVDPVGWVELVLNTPRWRGHLEGVDAGRVAALRDGLTDLARAHMDQGLPIGLEGLVAVARRAG
jgi:SAM-dependent methyltransferase